MITLFPMQDRAEKAKSHGAPVEKYAGYAAIIMLSALLPLWVGPKLFIGMVAGTAILLLVLINPRYGLLLIALTIPLEVAGTVGALTRHLPLTIPKILTLVTLFSTIIHVGMKKIQIRVLPWMYLLPAFLLMAVFSLMGAGEMKNGFEAVFRLSTTVLFFFLVVQLADSWKIIKRCLLILILSSTLASTYALIQRYLPQARFETRYSWEQSEGNVFGVEKSVLEEKTVGVVERSTGLSAHAILLALNVSLLIPLVVVFWRNTHAFDLTRILWLLFMVILLSSFVVTYSRTGFVLLLFSFGMMFIKRLAILTPFTLVVCVAAGILLISFPPPRFIDRVLSVKSYTSQSHSYSVRMELFQAGWMQFKDHFLTGVGYGNRYDIFKYYACADKKSAVTPHNAYIQVASQTGVFALALLLAFFFKVHRNLCRVIKTLQKNGQETFSRIGQALDISILTFLLCGLVLDLFDKGMPQAWLIISLSVAYSLQFEPKPAGFETNALETEPHRLEQP